MSDKRLPHAGPGRPKDPSKRLAILAAAKTLFMRNGYEGSSMDAIAAEAGVSKLTVYNHFTDKETLFSAAVKSKCEEQLPELFFDLPDEVSLEKVLRNIGHGFVQLANSRESIELLRVMVSLATTDATLAQLFFNAGPQRVLNELEGLLRKAATLGKLHIDNPQHAAEHFLSLLKGGCNFRLLLGCCPPPTPEEEAAHVEEVVQLFLRAYRPCD